MPLDLLPADFERFLGDYRGPYRWKLSAWPDRATAYVLGQLLPGARKSMQPMAARLHQIPYEVIQQFITDSPWDWESIQLQTVEQVRDRVGGEDGLVNIDDTAFVKAGEHSVGVARQYCGQLGKVANCQVGVACVYVRQHPERSADAGVFPLLIQLYLPQEWASDARRRRKVRVPRAVKFRKKWEIALDLVDAVRERGLPHAAVGADASYGDSSEFRAGLGERGERYVVGVNLSSLHVVRAGLSLRKPRKGPTGRPETSPRLPRGVRARSAARLLKTVPRKEWREITWAEGTKEPLRGFFAKVKVRVTKKQRPTEEVDWLLFERRENETKGYLCHGFDDSSLEDLVKVARGRWPIEQFFREAKDEVGMDHFEGRTWPGWHHHTTLTFMTMWYLAQKRWMQQKEGKDEPLPTLPEVRRQAVRGFGEKLVWEAFKMGLEDLPDAGKRLLALIEASG